MAEWMSKLEAVLIEFNFDCAVIADASGSALLRLGRFIDEESIEALNRDFYDPPTVRLLAEALKGNLLPQISARGQRWALKGFTPDGSVVALYGIPPGDAVAQYHASKRIWSAVTDALCSGRN